MTNRLIQMSLVAVALCLVSRSAGLADGRGKSVPRPLDRAPTLLEHDCGIVTETKLAIHEFRYRNETNSAVHVSDIGVTCGCLKVVDPPSAIGPGEFGTFRVEFSLKGYIGPVSQSASITFRDNTIPPLVLRIQAVAPGLQIRPALVEFGKLRVGNAATQDAKIFVGGLLEARIVDISSSDDRLAASFDEIDVNPQEVARAMAPLADVHIQLHVGPGDDVGRFEGLLHIKTNVPGQEILQLPVRANVVGEYEAKPETAFFGTVGVGKSIARTIALVRDVRDASADLGRTPTLTADHDEVSAEIMESKDGRDKWKLVIRYSPNLHARNGILRGRVVGRTDGKIVLAVPYVAYVNQP